MNKFLRHPKFWLPLLLLLAVEGVFRAGFWEPMARPNSHAGTSVSLKRAVDTIDPLAVTAITLGDSRIVFGLDHPLIKARDPDDGVHLSLALQGTHLATLKVVGRWARETFPNLSSVVIGVSPRPMSRPGSGVYEIGMVEPFRRTSDYYGLIPHFPPRVGDPGSLGGLSALMAYREDLVDAMQQPIERSLVLEKAARRPADKRLGFRNPRQWDLCEYDLSSIDSCQRELRRLATENRSTEPVARSFARYCRVGGATPTAVGLQANAAWRGVLEQFGKDLTVTVVLIPDHSVITNPVDLASARSLLLELEAEGVIRLLDLRQTLTDGEESECAYYSDLLHANQRGMTIMTRRLLEVLAEETD